MHTEATDGPTRWERYKHKVQRYKRQEMDAWLTSRHSARYPKPSEHPLYRPRWETLRSISDPTHSLFEQRKDLFVHKPWAKAGGGIIEFIDDLEHLGVPKRGSVLVPIVEQHGLVPGNVAWLLKV